MQHIGKFTGEIQSKIMAAKNFDMKYIDCEKCGSPRESGKTCLFDRGDSKSVICLSCESKQKAIETEEGYKVLQAKRQQEFFNEYSMGMNDELKAATFESFDPETKEQKEAHEEAKLLIEKLYSLTLDTENLLLAGSYGIGKSHLAAAACKEVLARGSKAIFIDVPTLITEIKSTWNRNAERTEKEILSWLFKADLLVLDDIGASAAHLDDQANKTEVSTLFQITNNRQGKATIYTTNMQGKQLAAYVGDRVMSRIMNKTVAKEVKGKTRRKRAAAQEWGF